MPEVIPYRFRVRRRTAASWASLNEVLLDSEIGLETDTRKFKIGDGSTAWNSMNYAGWGLLNGTPADGQVPTWDDVNGVWVPGDASAGGTAPGYKFCENFLRGVATGTSGAAFTANEWRPVAYTTGAGAGVSLDSPGAILTTGTSTSGFAVLYATAGARLKPGREVQRYGCRVEFPVLSNGTDSYTFTFGLLHTTNGTDTDRINARYTHSANGGNWILRAMASSSQSESNSSVPVVAATEADIELQISPAADEVKLAVNDAVVATITTDIPTVPLGLACFMFKNGGTTARTARIVRMWMR